VHHRTIQINHKPDATILQFIILTFVYSSTWFGRFPAHHWKIVASGWWFIWIKCKTPVPKGWYFSI